jgi:hypothetical protein
MTLVPVYLKRKRAERMFTVRDEGTLKTATLPLDFLISNYQCIWNEGCKGCQDPGPYGCCYGGADFGGNDGEKLRVSTEQLVSEHPELWHRANHYAGRFFRSLRKPGPLGIAGARMNWNWKILFNRDKSWEGYRTKVYDGRCEFFNPEDHEHHGCALHALALKTGKHHTETKAQACWVLPFTATYHFEGDWEHVAVTVVKSHHWIAGQDEDVEPPVDTDHPNWWCIEDEAAYIGKTSVLVSMQDELIELIGEELYWRAWNYIEEESKAGRL